MHLFQDSRFFLGHYPGIFTEVVQMSNSAEALSMHFTVSQKL